MINHYDIVGFCGVAIAIFAYARVQYHRDFAKTLQYSVLNLLNSLMLVYSLTDKWNMAAFGGNVIWAGISIYGIFRCLSYERRGGKNKKAKGKTFGFLRLLKGKA